MTLTQYLSEKTNFDYINSSVSDAERKKRLAELKRKFDSQSNFSTDNQVEFGQAERTEAAIFDVRRLTVRHSVADSIKTYLLKRNELAQKKKEKAKQNNSVSRPFWY